MAQWNNNQDDEQRRGSPEDALRRQQPDEQSAPIYGEAQPIPEQQTFRLRLPYAKPRAVWVLLALNITIFAVPWLLARLGVQAFGLPIDLVVRVLGAKDNQAISQQGQYYRLLTAMFLHAGIIHIGFNAYALYSLGPQAEQIYGTMRFLALYFIAGLAGSVTSYALNPAAGVGASGAIFGLIGGLAAFFYVARKVLGEISRQQLGSLITVIMINLFIGFSTPAIDNTAHIGGLVGGLAVGWLLAPRFEIDTRIYPPIVVRQSWPLAWPGAVGLLALLIVLAMIINPPIR